MSAIVRVEITVFGRQDVERQGDPVLAEIAQPSAHLFGVFHGCGADDNA